MSITKQLVSKARVYSLALFMAALLFSGCSSSGSSSNSGGTTSSLVVGEEVEIFSGDEIKPATDDTEISVRHLLGSDKKFVTLVSGDADLVRGDVVFGE